MSGITWISQTCNISIFVMVSPMQYRKAHAYPSLLKMAISKYKTVGKWEMSFHNDNWCEWWMMTTMTGACLYCWHLLDLSCLGSDWWVSGGHRGHRGRSGHWQPTYPLCLSSTVPNCIGIQNATDRISTRVRVTHARSAPNITAEVS